MATETPKMIDRSALPTAGTWTFDKNHNRLEFVARHIIREVKAYLIRTAMVLGLVHPNERVTVNRPARSQVNDRNDAAHD